jgi:chromosome segregation ATPase
LSKIEIQDRDRIIVEIEKQRTVLAAKLADVNEAIEAANEKISEYNGAISDLNGLIAEAEEWRDGIVYQMEAYIEERSEKWHDSDAGQTYAGWKSEYENVDFSAVDEVEEIPEVEEADFSIDDDIGALSETHLSGG